jgi:hypothetical protein
MAERVGQLVELANTYGAIETLSESVLLIHLSKGMLPLALTLHVCIRSKVSYKVLFFEEAPRWVPSSDNISIRGYPDEHKLKS